MECWVGFNASHSYGLILFSAVYGYPALAHGDVLFHSIFLLTPGLVLPFCCSATCFSPGNT